MVAAVYFISGAGIAFGLFAIVLNVRTNRQIARIRSGR